MRPILLPAVFAFALVIVWGVPASAQTAAGSSPQAKRDSTVSSAKTAPARQASEAGQDSVQTARKGAGADSVKTAGTSGAGEAAADSAKAADPLSYTRPVFMYDPGGRRDPFNSLLPKEVKEEKKIKGLLEYEKAVVRGIVKTDTEACALVVDGDNYSHVLRKNDKVANGYVSDITDEAVYLHIVQYGRASNIILRMETARQTVRGSEDGGEIVKRPGIDLTFEGGGTADGEVGVEDIEVPMHRVRTVEDVWFGADAGAEDGSPVVGACLLVGPKDGADVQFPQLFRWSKTADDSLYTLVFSEDKEFRSRLVVKEEIASTSCLFAENPGLEYGKKYFWKVVALKRSGKWVNSRNHLSFMLTDTIMRGTTDEKK